MLPHEAPKKKSDSERAARAPEDAALSAHMRSGVRAPMAALRAVLEGARADWPRAERALAELLKVDRAIEDLWRWSVPEPLRAVPCTLGEVVASLADTLDPLERERLWIVSEDAETRIVTDGVRLVSDLVRLVRSSLSEAGTEVMLHAHADEERASFSLVDDSGDVPAADVAEVPADLALLLAQRNVDRLGGTLSVHQTSSRHRCVVIRVPRDGGCE